MKIVNLTPHDVKIIADDGNIVAVFKPSGVVARVSSSTEKLGVVEVDGVKIPITHNVFGDVVNIPEGDDDTLFIVSTMVAQAAADKAHLCVPNEFVRDGEGNIIGCRSLARF